MANNRANRRSKRAKRRFEATTKTTVTKDATMASIAEEIIEEEGGADDATTAAGNSNVGAKTRPHCSYLLLRAAVPESKKGTATMKTKFQEIFSLLLEADESSILSIFKTDPTPAEDGSFVSPANKVLTATQDFPDSITSLSKYFFGCRPNSKGGSIWTQIRLMHSSPIENILEDVREDLREMESSLTLQSIQHWDVATIGFLKNLHHEVDGPSLQEFLNTELYAVHRDDTYVVGIKVKTPYDGKKKSSTPVTFKDRIHAFHVDTIGSVQKEVAATIKGILAGDSFKARYNCNVRLVPCFDRNSSPYTQEKVRKCILQHSQWCQCVTTMSVEDIATIDSKNKHLGNRTLRELIIGLPASHFINIDLNWSKTHYCIIYPKKYEALAKDKIAHLGAYLHRHYGDNILSSLTPNLQQVIWDTVWDEKTGRPISKLDRELDAIIDGDESLDYVDASFLTNAAPSPSAASASATFVPKASPVPQEFVPVQDDCSVSTFGTAVYKTPPKESNVPSLQDTNDSSTVVSSITMDTRVSKVETDLGDIKSMITQLLHQQAASGAASPSLGKAGQQG